jgi:GT2 family glycosyltransferase
MPAVSLIVAVYKNIAVLELILKALDESSLRDFEVIVTEDNDGTSMQAFVESQQSKHFFSIKHLSQPDDGFRKDRALNRAVATAQADLLVFIDGDCVPHPYFLEAHYQHRAPKVACYGRRVMLSESLSKEVLTTADLSKLNFWQVLRHGSQRLDSAMYLPFITPKMQDTTAIWGCNWSIHKADLQAVNGFDEDYTKPGIGEDTDVEWRLFKAGIRLKKIKFQAIQYHFHHPENYASTQENEDLMQQKIIEGKAFCTLGLDQHQSPEVAE